MNYCGAGWPVRRKLIIVRDPDWNWRSCVTDERENGRHTRRKLCEV